jgi:hypothetical protein
MFQSVEIARRDPSRAPSTQAPVWKPGRFVVPEAGLKAGDIVRMVKVPAGVTVLAVDLLASLGSPGRIKLAVGDEEEEARYFLPSAPITGDGGRFPSNTGSSIHDVEEASTIDLKVISGEVPAGSRLAVLVAYIASSK